MLRFLAIALSALLAFQFGPALAAPPRAKDRPVRETPRQPRPEEAKPETPREGKPRSRRRWPGAGAVVVVPPSELSSSPDPSRADGRGARPSGRLTAFAPLIGADETGLNRSLGAPAARRDEGQGALVTYRLKTCALHVFLTRDAAGALRVKGASTGPLKRGLPAPTVDACVAEAEPG